LGGGQSFGVHLYWSPSATSTSVLRKNLYSEKKSELREKICTPRKNLYSEKKSVLREKICTPRKNLYSEKKSVLREKICTPRKSMCSDKNMYSEQKFNSNKLLQKVIVLPVVFEPKALNVHLTYITPCCCTLKVNLYNSFFNLLTFKYVKINWEYTMYWHCQWKYRIKLYFFKLKSRPKL